MNKPEKKRRSEWIYSTTADQVEQIGLEISPDGASIRFTQDMVRTHVETSYDRERKSPKILNKTPTKCLNIEFTPSAALKQFDYLVAIDTNTKTFRGERVSVTAVNKGELNWLGQTNGLRPAIRSNLGFCFEFMEIEDHFEQVGWFWAIGELMQESRFQESKNIGVLVDSTLDNLAGYNERTIPIYSNFYLPSNMTLIYATSDAGGEYMVNWLLRTADSAAGEVLRSLERGQIPMNKSKVNGFPFKGIRKIQCRQANFISEVRNFR